MAFNIVALLLAAGMVGLPRWRQYLAEREARRLAAPMALIDAADAGDVAKVKQALADGASPNTLDSRMSCIMAPEHALTNAVMRGRVEAANVLLDAGANPNELCANFHNGSVLSYATMRQDVETVKLLIHYGADPNRDRGSSQTPLRLAAYFHNPGLLARLLNAGADPNDADTQGTIVLHTLAWRGTPVDIELALKHGANVNQVDLAGRTPLDIAISDENRATLLRAGAVIGTGRDAEAD